MSRILVVYYSRTGKTQWTAEKLAEMLGADIERITEEKDRSGKLGWLGAGKDTMTDKPAKLTSQHSTEGRDVVIVGMPVWAASPPPAVRAYLQQVDLAGKTVCAFCTFEGGGGEKCLDAVARLVPAGLAARALFKKVKPDKPEIVDQITQWVEVIKPLTAE